MKRTVPLLLMAAAMSAHAGWYVPAQVGRTNYPRPGDDTWYQQAYTNEIQERANTETIGVGYEASPYLSFEADYRDLGTNRISASWESDQSYGAWEIGKDPTVYGSTKDHLSGFVASTLIGYPLHKITPYVRLGAMWYRWTHQIMWSNNSNAHAVSEFSYGCTTRGVTPVYGVGVRYGRVTIEYDAYHPYAGDDVHLCTANFSNPSSVTIGYRF